MSRRRKPNSSRRRGAACSGRVSRPAAVTRFETLLHRAPPAVHACLRERSDLFDSYERQACVQKPDNVAAVGELLMEAVFSDEASPARSAELLDEVDVEDLADWCDHAEDRLLAYDELKDAATVAGFALTCDPDSIFRYLLTCSHPVCRQHELDEMSFDSPFPSLDVVRDLTDSAAAPRVAAVG